MVQIMVLGQAEGASEINASEIEDKILKGEAVDYNDVTVQGDLNLSKLGLPKASYRLKTVISPIRITNSTIDGMVDFSKTIFKQPVNLVGTAILGKASFRDSQFDEYANFQGCRFREPADFSRSRFNGDFNSEQAEFNGADFLDAQFNGSADFADAYFNAALPFYRGNLSAFFGRSRFYGRADFTDARFNGHALFGGCRFYGMADFAGAHFNESADLVLHNTSFKLY